MSRNGRPLGLSNQEVKPISIEIRILWRMDGKRRRKKEQNWLQIRMNQESIHLLFRIAVESQEDCKWRRTETETSKEAKVTKNSEYSCGKEKNYTQMGTVPIQNHVKVILQSICELIPPWNHTDAMFVSIHLHKVEIWKKIWKYIAQSFNFIVRSVIEVFSRKWNYRS